MYKNVNDITVDVHSYNGTIEEFSDVLRIFLAGHDRYRGFSQLCALIDSYSLDEFFLYQADIDGLCVGLAAVQMVDNILIFGVLAVAPEFREVGVGDALFDYIIHDEQFKNAIHYESYALPGDRSTKNFFEQRKGKARLITIIGEVNR